jgi:amino acid transporter
MLLIIGCGLYWWLSGQPLATSLKDTPLLPDLRQLSNLGFLIAVTISFFGMEIPAVHAGNVINPKRDFPKSLWISGSLILILTLLATLSISIIVPVAKLSVVTGLLDALLLFFNQFHWGLLLSVIFFLVFIGNMGSVMAWMLGSTRGMFVACTNNHVSKFLQKTNRNEAPIGVLIFEAILFTVAMLIFLIFPKVSDSFWLLLVVASQITLIYYVILFFTAMKLKNNFKFWSLMILGAFISIASLIFGFIPPPDLNTQQITLFHTLLTAGLFISIVLPIVLLKIRKKLA